MATLQRELMEHGPVEVSFYVFSDFISYRSGVYVRTPGAYGPLGGHAVRLLGWGAEEQKDKGPVDYWLLANSYSPPLGGSKEPFMCLFKGYPKSSRRVSKGPCAT